LLSPSEAAAIARRGRKLLRAGRITPHELVLLDCLLWSCRSKEREVANVSYSALRRLTRLSRTTIAKGLRKVQRLGVLSVVKRRVRLAWHQGGIRSLQAVSSYILLPTRAPDTESTRWTVSQSDSAEIICVPFSDAVVQAAQEALARRRAVTEPRLALEVVR
jgi:hypothetical protein